jgi:bacterioferritin
MIREGLVAERIAIESDGKIIRYLGANDPTTRRLLGEILAVEETEGRQHPDDHDDEHAHPLTPGVLAMIGGLALISR